MTRVKKLTLSTRVTRLELQTLEEALSRTTELSDADRRPPLPLLPPPPPFLRPPRCCCACASAASESESLPVPVRLRSLLLMPFRR